MLANLIGFWRTKRELPKMPDRVYEAMNGVESMETIVRLFQEADERKQISAAECFTLSNGLIQACNLLIKENRRVYAMRLARFAYINAWNMAPMNPDGQGAFHVEIIRQMAIITLARVYEFQFSMLGFQNLADAVKRLMSLSKSETMKHDSFVPRMTVSPLTPFDRAMQAQMMLLLSTTSEDADEFWDLSDTDQLKRAVDEGYIGHMIRNPLVVEGAENNVAIVNGMVEGCK